MSSYPIAYGRFQVPRSTRSQARVASLAVLAVVVATLVLSNLTIVSLHLWARSTTPMASTAAPTGVHNFYVVDHKVLRGSRPNEDAYRDLAASGVTTVVDLRAEEGLERPGRLLHRLGIDLVHIPMRDGQAPTDAQVDRFIAAVRNSAGEVYVHCMAGVGRTGTMVAAYLVEERGLDENSALRMNMAVGPPTLEQIAFASEIERPNPVVVGFSRFLDAPRRMWTYVN